MERKRSRQCFDDIHVAGTLVHSIRHRSFSSVASAVYRHEVAKTEVYKKAHYMSSMLAVARIPTT